MSSSRHDGRREDDLLDSDLEPASAAREVGARPRSSAEVPITSEVAISRASGIAPRTSAWTIESDAAGLSLDPPAPERVPSMMLRLSREIGIDRQDDEIVHAFVEAMRDVFPARRFVLRLVAPEGGDVSLFYASGRLAGIVRDPLVLERSAAARHALDEAVLARLGVTLSDQFVPFFEAGAAGFDVPLNDGERLLGILSVEYPAGVRVPAWDAPILVPLALELGSKLRSARLLRESTYLRDYLGQVIQHANAPIIVLRRDRTIETANLAALRITGGERERWVGRDFLEMLPASDRARATAAIETALRGLPTNDVELRMPRASGGFARVAFNTASISAPEGEIAGVVAIGRDLTEVRDLEEQIIQAEKLATLGQLAAGVVHELNNPLTSISVYGEYLLSKGERAGHDAADLEKLRRIVDSADRILRFTRDLVTYARPSTEEPAFVPIGEVIEQSLLFCDHVVNEACARVVKRFDSSAANVYAIKGQLHQVFINLITNACHALPPVDGEIVLGSYFDENELVHITVEDNGSGIPEAVRDKIFEPFYSTKGEGQGTGLGLSIVRNIVEQHGGVIEVRPRDGGGTVFEIRLPGRAGG